MANSKPIDIQHNHVIVSAGETVAAGYVGLLAKVDGLYEILPGGVERKLYNSNAGMLDDISFEFRDIGDGTAILYVLDIKASFAYTILSAVLACDADTITGAAIKINGTAVTSLSSVTVTTTTTETAATALNVVALDDKVTITGTGLTGSAAALFGKLKIQRNG